MGTVVEKVQYLEGTKQAIKKALKSKGVDVSDTDTFRSYAEKIKEIGSGGGGGSSVAEYKFINTLELQTYPAQPYSEDNNFIYPSFADYMSSDKEFCCTANIADGYTGDVYKLFDGNETTYSAPSFFFRFNEKKKVKKLHIVITSADYWGGTPIIYGTNYSDHMTSQDTSYWTELYNFNGVVGEHIIDLSDANYQYFWFSDDRINVSKFEVIAETGVIAMSLSSANMTPSFKCYPDNYMQVITQDWYNGSEVIPSQTLIFKPYEDGGCLVNYTDDGKATNLKMYYAKSSGQIISKSWKQPVLSSKGTLGGDSFAVYSYYEESSDRDICKAFDGNETTTWASGTPSTPVDIIFYNPTPINVSNIHIKFKNGEVYSSGNIYGSNDNGSYSLVGSFSNNSEDEIDVEINGNYKYFKIEFTSLYSGWGHVAEIRITATENEIKDDTYFISNDDITPPSGYESITKVADLNIPERLP